MLQGRSPRRVRHGRAQLREAQVEAERMVLAPSPRWRPTATCCGAAERTAVDALALGGARRRADRAAARDRGRGRGARRGTEGFAAARMNRGIRQALAGRNVDDLNDRSSTILPHAELCPEGKTVNAAPGTSDLRGLLENGVEIEHACERLRLHDLPCIVREGCDSLGVADEAEATCWTAHGAYAALAPLVPGHRRRDRSGDRDSEVHDRPRTETQ